MVYASVFRTATMSKYFTIGDRVKLIAAPPYLKTAEPMPMLRPGDTLQVGDQGTILEQRPGGYWSIKFERGSFLLDSEFLEKVRKDGDQSS
ncbi:MAG: regulatory protein SipA [Nodosilinea sp.]